jgi:hypothetical protein
MQLTGIHHLTAISGTFEFWEQISLDQEGLVPRTLPRFDTGTPRLGFELG